MARIRVPEAARPSLLLLIRLTSETLSQLLQAIDGARPTLQHQALVHEVSEQVADLPADELESIMDTLITLSAVLSTVGLSVEEMAADLASSPDLAIPEGERPAAEERFATILRARSLAVAAKAFDVLTSYEKTLHDVRILTDMRPIFLDSPDTEPAAAAIVHNLRIQYHSDDALHSVTVAMTPAHLEVLMTVVKRANDKAIALKSFLDVAGLPSLEGAID